MSDEYEMMGEYQQAIADWKSDYDTLLKNLYEKDEKITELKTEIAAEKKRFASVMLRKNTYIAHVERKNELLLGELEKTLQTIKSWWDSDFIYARYAGPGEMEDYIDTTERLQAAIYGGALDEDGEK